MLNTKSIALPNLGIRGKAITISVLLLISIVVPTFVHSQFITGPLVNAILLIAAVLVGPFEAVFIGLVPSTVALSSGLLPVALAPMVPFIMISNAVYVGVFHYIRTKSFSWGVIVASIIKFAFLYSIVTLLMKTLLAEQLVAKLAVMMSWPQLATALAGGVIAYIILKALKKV